MASLPTPGVTPANWGDELNAAIESLHLQGTHAARPTTNLVTSTLYSCSDHNLIYQWNGAAWVTWSALPAGVITMYGGATAPAGYLLCQGQSITTAAYPDLHAAIGYTYGGSAGNFNIPDLRVRLPIGAGTGKALGANDGAAETSRDANHSHSHGHAGSTTSISSDSAGTPSGTNTAVTAGTPAGSLSSDSAGTPSGDNTPVTAGTPTGSVPSHASHTHSIGSLSTGAGGTHYHNVTGQAPAGTWTTPNTGTNLVTRSGNFDGHAHGGSTGSEAAHTHVVGTHSSDNPSATLTHTFTGNALGTHDHAFTGNTLSGHSHTFTGSALTTHNHTFTGSAMGNHTHTATPTIASGGSADHPFTVVNYIIKT